MKKASAINAIKGIIALVLILTALCFAVHMLFFMACGEFVMDGNIDHTKKMFHYIFNFRMDYKNNNNISSVGTPGTGLDEAETSGTW